MEGRNTFAAGNGSLHDGVSAINLETKDQKRNDDLESLDEETRQFLPRSDPLDLIYDIRRNKSYVKICGPMVRYSKLPFRELTRDFGVDIAYTPMTLAKEFVNAQIARDSEYTTNERDTPVILQFAAKTVQEFGEGCEVAAPWIDGVDLNCGCPQRWAVAEGIGAHLMSKPELVSEMVREAKSRSSKRPNGGPVRVSIKIRVHDDLRRTVDFVRRAEMAGVDWITVHGRTRKQKSTEPVNAEAIALVSPSGADLAFNPNKHERLTAAISIL